MESQLSRKKKVVFSFITFFLAFGFFNGLARLVSPKDSVFWENPLMVMYPVEEFDESVTIEYCNYNDNPNRPVRYVSHRQRWYRLNPEPLIPEDGQLIFHFGDSSTWGWGLQDRGNAYPGTLGKLLPNEVHSINLGVPGYSSLQGLRYVEELLPKYHQRVVGITLYFGNNDSTENGSSDADKLKKEIRTWVKAVRWFPLFRVIHDSIVRIEQRDNQRPRVSPEEYEVNLRQMIVIAQSYRIPTVLIEPPRHLSWRPGYLTHTTSLQTKVQNNWVAEELERASKFYAEGLGRIVQRSDEYSDLLQAALGHDWVIARIKTEWLQRFPNFSRIENVTCIRLPDPFVEAEYPYTFTDYCHPSSYVHVQLAKRIKDALGYN